MIVWRHSISFLLALDLKPQAHLCVPQVDERLSAGVELQEIFFDPIAENDAVLRHLGFELQRCFRRHAAKDERGARCVAWETAREP